MHRRKPVETLLLILQISIHYDISILHCKLGHNHIPIHNGTTHFEMESPIYASLLCETVMSLNGNT